MRVLAAFIAACMLTLSAVGQSTNPPAQTENKKTLEEILKEDPGVKKARVLLDQTIQALGGPAYLGLQDMEQQGRSYAFYHGTPNGTGAPYWRFFKWPDKDRVELTKQRDVIYIYTDKKGWEITYKGTREVDADDLKEYLRNREHALDNVLRNWLKQPDTALFYEGTGLAQDKEVDKVTVMNGEGDGVTLFIDRLTHLPVKKSYQVRDPKSRELDEEAEVYDNWRPEQGIQTAHSIVLMRNGEMTRQRFVQSVAYNRGIPDSKFAADTTYVPKPTK